MKSDYLDIDKPLPVKSYPCNLWTAFVMIARGEYGNQKVALMSVHEMTCSSCAMTAPDDITIMVLLTVGPVVHPHRNVDPTSRRSRKSMSSTVPATLPMSLTMHLESLCPLTILMMQIGLPRMLLLFRILFKPTTRTT